MVAIVLVVGLWTRWPQHATFVYEDAKSQMTATTMTLGPRILTRWTWAMWPEAPTAQIVNLVLHAVTTVLLFWLMRRLDVHPFAQVAVPLLWWLHPLATEAVAYATGRADILALIGILIMCLCAASPTWYRPLNVGGMACGLLVGLAGKESALVGVVLVPLCLPRPLTNRRVAVILACVVGLLGVGIVWAYGGLQNLWRLGAVFNGQVVTVSPVKWALVQMTATARLIVLSVYPWLGQTVDYDYPSVTVTMQVMSAVFLAGLAAVAVLWREYWLISTGITWTLLASLPRWILQTPESYYNEHQFYAALPGMVMVLTGLLLFIPDLRVPRAGGTV